MLSNVEPILSKIINSGNKLGNIPSLVIIILLLLSAAFSLSEKFNRGDYKNPINVSLSHLYNLLTIMYFLSFLISIPIVLRGMNSKSFLSIILIVLGLTSILIVCFYTKNRKLKQIIFNESYEKCLAEFNNKKKRYLWIGINLILFTIYLTINIFFIMPGFIIVLFNLITNIINNSTKTILTEIYIITMIITVIFYQIVALVYSLNILKNYSIIDAKFYGDFDQTVARGS